jgi:hypothetical protein
MLLTSEQALKIANSQKDLGGKSQEELAKVLSDEGEAELDVLSRLIAVMIGDAEDLDEAEDNLSYAIEQLTKAMVAVSSINK